MPRPVGYAGIRVQEDCPATDRGGVIPRGSFSNFRLLNGALAVRTAAMTSYQSECVYGGGAVLAEGPVWDEVSQRYYWIDIERGRICRFDPRSRSNQEWILGIRLGFAVLTESGDLLAGTQDGLLRFSCENGQATPYANPEPDLPNNRFNDGKCDPQGRLWGGTMSIDESETKGTLYRIGSASDISPQHGPVSISNGLAWSSDSRRMYYIDSPTRRVDAFDYDPEKGSISHHRTAFELAEGMGYPDGMTIDAEDNVWVALWEGWGVGCFDPRSGEMLAKVEVPVARVTSCCFGGPELKDLMITTASRDLSEAERVQQPEAGGLFIARPGVTGTPSIRFKG